MTRHNILQKKHRSYEKRAITDVSSNQKSHDRKKIARDQKKLGSWKAFSRQDLF